MKRILMGLVLLGMTFGGTLWAHEGMKDKDGKMDKDQTLTGEVVCLNCYINHGAQGEAHAKCAKQCFDKGLPVGLKVGKKLYLLVGEHHTSANKMFNKYAGQTVTVSGHAYSADGMNMFEVESVKTASMDKAMGKKMYACKMCHVTSDKPGKCPECGMQMTEVTEKDKAMKD